MSDVEKKIVIDIPAWLTEKGIGFDERQSELILDKCYHCGKTKKMYVNKDTGMFNCFSCNHKGNLVKFVANIGQMSFEAAEKIVYNKKIEKVSVKTLEEQDWDSLFSLERKVEKPNLKDIPPDPIDMPRGLHKLTKEDTLAWEYLRKRGIPDEVIEDLGLYYSPFQRRVLFTIRKDGLVMGTMARDVTGEQKPKTLNSSGSWRSFNFWNYDNVKNQEEIVICEGIFSAIKCGPKRSLALMGKVAARGQINLLKGIKAKKVYLGLDIGTEEEQKKIYEELSVYFPGRIYQIQLPTVVETKAEISQEAIDRVNKQFKASITKVNQNLLNVPEKDKKAIKKAVKDKKILILPPDATELVKLLADAEYKDAGDYSFEEMDEFIKKAPLYKKS